ncbi:MAG: hypothetical protein WCF67_14370 [Chitinophagaceae bacterium]
MAKAKKKRADKYEKKLKISGSFEDVIKLSAQPIKRTEKKKEDQPGAADQ